jgi:hypothetical protein
LCGAAENFGKFAIRESLPWAVVKKIPFDRDMLRALLAVERNIAANFALRRKIVDRLVKWRTSNQDQSGMNNSENIANQRGGGDRARDDAFHFAPGNAHYAFAGIAALGIFAIAAAWLDLGGAQAKGDAIWLAPAGVFLVLFASGLYWLRWRKPALLVVGQAGLHLPVALARPVAWGEVWRISHTRRRISWFQELIILNVELTPGLQPRYKRSLMTIPVIDGWVAKKFGLRIPIQNLDAPAVTILASVERFMPVAR